MDEDKRPIYEKKRVIVPSITALILLIFGLIVTINSIFYKSTDDAFVEGHIITIAPRVSGPVIKLYIDDTATMNIINKIANPINAGGVILLVQYGHLVAIASTSFLQCGHILVFFLLIK